ncbi:DinB family protein [Deinococcus aquiradiocola]|uniref:DinB-like domain-containing protein n=1 Tax=Deinococcus aquiradiocola TaxID=393059 RepID=A0A917UKS4_9DEIO|nr:DinB family protein [Deinococcus aquiradiocola]GGJ64375.1 hypothetical protein GCM10008939_05380 [Deinococcus aquiradiocola]
MTTSNSSQLAFARLLPRLYRGGQAFVGVEASLSDLTPDQAARRPDGLPHSVADLLAHVNWWLGWMLEVIEAGEAAPYPAHASITWPETTAADWERLKGDFYMLLGRVDTHTSRPDLQNPVNHDETLGELLADFALHTAHHFGQIITVRQLIGAWPPASGGDTW